MDNITLIGMPGSGKSTVGVLLAKALGFGFLDTDLTIQHREGELLQTLVDNLGVEGFLEVETAAIQSVSCHHHVISPGGSAVCSGDAIGHLKAMGPVVYLRVPLEELTRRIRNISTRGIAMEEGQTLSDLMAYRAPLYEQSADFIVDCQSHQTLEETVSMVLTVLKEAGHMEPNPNPRGNVGRLS